jgi:hypothetical protein
VGSPITIVRVQTPFVLSVGSSPAGVDEDEQQHEDEQQRAQDEGTFVLHQLKLSVGEGKDERHRAFPS